MGHIFRGEMAQMLIKVLITLLRIHGCMKQVLMHRRQFDFTIRFKNSTTLLWAS